MPICETCGEEWPEPYCRECGHSIGAANKPVASPPLPPTSATPPLIPPQSNRTPTKKSFPQWAIVTVVALAVVVSWQCVRVSPLQDVRVPARLSESSNDGMGHAHGRKGIRQSRRSDKFVHGNVRVRQFAASRGTRATFLGDPQVQAREVARWYVHLA
jgi:hypothetical protein